MTLPPRPIPLTFWPPGTPLTNIRLCLQAEALLVPAEIVKVFLNGLPKTSDFLLLIF